MPNENARIKEIEDTIASLTANLTILKLEKIIQSYQDDSDIFSMQTRLQSVEDQLSDIYTALAMLEAQKQKIITQNRLKTLQSFFDKKEIEFDVSLFLYLLTKTVRAIGVSETAYHFTHYPFDEMNKAYEHYKVFHDKASHQDAASLLRQFKRVNIAFSQLAFTFYYLDAILGPTLHSIPILARLFQLVKADSSLPQDDLDAMNALMCVFCYQQKSLKAFLHKHSGFYHLKSTIKMVRRYIGYRSPLSDKLNENRIKKHFEKKLSPTAFQLKQLHQLSGYAYQAQHEALPFFATSVTKDKKRLTMGALSKLADYYCDRRMILKDAELSLLLDKSSPLHTILSQTLFSYPDSPTGADTDFEGAYDCFPIPDDQYHPHGINFFP